jgi:hypothetical protein
MVGVTGFEPVAFRTPCGRATRLRHTPILKAELLCFREEFGRSERIRTFDPSAPNRVHYQAVLRSDVNHRFGDFFKSAKLWCVEGDSNPHTLAGVRT